MAKVGRPKIKIDYAQVEKLASIFCTQEEIATFFDVSVRTLQNDPEFLHVYKRGQSDAKRSLRRTLAKHAETYYQCAIFLAKNFLGMSDRELYEVHRTPIEISEGNIVGWLNSKSNGNTKKIPA